MALYLVACVLSVIDAQDFTVYETYTTAAGAQKRIPQYNCWNDALHATPSGYELATWNNDWEYKEAVDYLKAEVPTLQAWTGMFFTVSATTSGQGEFRVPNVAGQRPRVVAFDRQPISQNVMKQAKDGMQASVKRGDVSGPPLPASRSQHNVHTHPGESHSMSGSGTHSSYYGEQLQTQLRIDQSTHNIFSVNTDHRGNVVWDHRSWRSFIPTTGALMFQKDPPGDFDCEGKLKFGFRKAALWRRIHHHHTYPHVYNVYTQIPDHPSKYIWHDWYEAIDADCPGGLTVTARQCREELFTFLGDLNIKQVDKFELKESDWKNWKRGMEIISAQEEYSNVYEKRDISGDYNAFVDYEYDKAIEKARESRELKRLQKGKMKLLRLKKASAKTHYKKQKQGYY